MSAPPIRAVRLLDRPIIDPITHPAAGNNIQGPSLMVAPPWLDEPLARYYLYFADHKGDHIRLALADDVTGPWRLHEPGSLHLATSCFLTEPPEATDEQLEYLRGRYEAVLGSTYSIDGLLTDATTPHIASPDVHIDSAREQVVMYFHGLDSLAVQVTRVAVSSDGVHFTALPDVIGGPYLRVFQHDDMFYGLTMPGQFCRSPDGITEWEVGPTLFPITMRHSALHVRGDQLDVIWSRVGDAPESLLVSTIDIGGDWSDWVAGPDRVLLDPEREWEGAALPVEPSMRGGLNGPANQLRDPAVFVDGDRTYLLYAVAGESGLALGELVVDDERQSPV